MGKLSYEKGKFYFTPQVECRNPRNHRSCEAARKAAFQFDSHTLRWATRNIRKAAKLRQFADASAEQKFKKYFVTRFELPEHIPYPDHLDPKPFQLESAWHCLGRSPAYCADEAGLGKTITSILCMNAVPGKVLIICPPFLKYNWAKEVETWWRRWKNPGAKSITIIEEGNADEKLFGADILILPDSLITNPRIKVILSQYRFTWLFVDEAHRFKEATTKRTQDLVGRPDDEDWFYAAKNCERVVFLSATPIPNGRPVELFPVLSALCPSAIGHRNLQSFGISFCNGKQVTHYEGGRPIVTWDFTGASNLKKFRRELRETLMIRHLKKDVMAELGPKTRSIVFLDKPGKLERYEKKILKNFSLDELMGEDHELGDIATYRMEVGQVKILPSFHYIHQLLDNTNEKLVVFAYHVEVVETLHRMLKDFGALMIRGGVSAKEKNASAIRFQTDKRVRVIVGNLDAMGTGLTLTKAKRTITVEPAWAPGVNEQAEDRIHRITQGENTYHQYLALRNSLDERMLSKVLSKQDAINEVMA